MLQLLAPVLLGLASGPRPLASQAGTVECRFSNPSFSGYCNETVDAQRNQTPSQACRAVLDCLNNPMCTKTYCSATTIRTGWRLEQAKPAQR